ncbi:MAG: MmcB family DNA repair protein, partial [Pseudomonadota bacterium]
MSEAELSEAPDISDPVVNPDGRQSATAAAVQRGTGRMLLNAGFASISELSLANGRRADLIAVNAKGEI